MKYEPVMTKSFEEARLNDYRKFITQLGSEINFDSDKWVCDKRIRSTAELKCDVTLYFSTIPEKYKEAVKYFCAIYLINGIGIATAASKITSLASLCRFLDEYYPDAQPFDVSIHMAADYRTWLDRSGLSESTKILRWRELNTFYRIMRGWNDMLKINPFSENPYPYCRRQNYKYIPESVITQLDKTFLDEKIPIHIRCVLDFKTHSFTY
jgi:hypothetical protein